MRYPIYIHVGNKCITVRYNGLTPMSFDISELESVPMGADTQIKRLSLFAFMRDKCNHPIYVV